jgi:hypothetical protein
VRLEDLNGGMTLTGRFDGETFHSRGELSIDSVVYKGLQLTQVLGPVWIDDSRVLLGAWADRVAGVQPERRIPIP